MKKLLVTGGLGFIGSNLVELLLKKNFYVINSEEFFFHNDFNFHIKKIIPEEFKGMNQYVFFGNESNVDEIIMCAKKFPMMGDKQLIIVKDGNKIFKNFINSPGNRKT